MANADQHARFLRTTIEDSLTPLLGGRRQHGPQAKALVTPPTMSASEQHTHHRAVRQKGVGGRQNFVLRDTFSSNRPVCADGRPRGSR